MSVFLRLVNHDPEDFFILNGNNINDHGGESGEFAIQIKEIKIRHRCWKKQFQPSNQYDTTLDL
ncbi:hypothetical protein PSM36_2603 [Proteiniphilum saccharofermentans]|uniref:Uncharacterized protein n=1 Tax=Proteiniphilum saccharofermentans TaxID=1642647 RepID=A0A1R3TCS5_9BACT|nr:hypothetical protein PSM36_2603 [Proteiniphilum saccharofermentans]